MDPTAKAPESGRAATPGEPEDAAVPRWVRGLLRDLAVAFVVLTLVGVFLVQPFRVEGRSMAPLLQPGERLLVDKVSYRFGDPGLGEVVVFRSPEGRTLVKRVAGLPGDVVEAPDGTRTLGPGEYWLLGDNREASIDSRRFGAVERRSIGGRVALRYWPLATFGALPADAADEPPEAPGDEPAKESGGEGPEAPGDEAPDAPGDEAPETPGGEGPGSGL